MASVAPNVVFWGTKIKWSVGFGWNFVHWWHEQFLELRFTRHFKFLHRRQNMKVCPYTMYGMAACICRVDKKNEKLFGNLKTNFFLMGFNLGKIWVPRSLFQNAIWPMTRFQKSESGPSDPKFSHVKSQKKSIFEAPNYFSFFT